MSKLLKLHVSYKEHIRELEAMKPNESNNLNGEIEKQDIVDHLHKRRIQHRLSNLRTAYELLGIRRGEKIPSKWMSGLSKTEQRIFKDYFERRKRYSEIGSDLGLSRQRVRAIIRYSIKQVIKNIGGS